MFYCPYPFPYPFLYLCPFPSPLPSSYLSLELSFSLRLDVPTSDFASPSHSGEPFSLSIVASALVAAGASTEGRPGIAAAAIAVVAGKPTYELALATVVEASWRPSSAAIG